MTGAVVFIAAISLILFFGLLYIGQVDSGYTLTTAPTSWILFDLSWAAVIAIIYFVALLDVVSA